ncbi:MAG TPA: protein-tyrosine-phosphatase [Flavobacteriales bacterium]|nr:protein-tyrosine-phosphatase [Flavobacteriales bacterium]
MIRSIEEYCRQLPAEFNLIPQERKILLEKISAYINTKQKENKTTRLVYVCTHNSRRSHFGQVWAHVAAVYFHLHNVKTYSGGTEATAFHPNAINALKRIGFIVEQITEGKNPAYEVHYDEKQTPVICFSKVYDHADNPKKEFAAIMTCSDAEENCPFIPGVELRIGTMYDDPKAFDNTPQQDAKYDERCRQIARETFYVFSRV